MVVDWPSITLKEAAKFYSGGTPSKSKSEYWGGDIPWISAKSMYGNRFSDSDLKLTEEGLNAGSRLAPKDSILLLVRGSMLHQKIPLGIATKPVAFNQDVKAIIPSKEFLPEFFYYSLAAREHELLSKVESTGIGAGKLDSDVLNNFEILCPPIIEQVAIVTVFRTIDDKIERNTQLNQTLESMAQAIFKSWFVDFDPVIDNAIAAGNPIPEPFQAQAERRRLRLHEPVPEGQSPLQPLPAELRQLFPNSFHETEELGWVPEGWFSRPFGSIIETAIGGDWGKDVEDEVHTEKVKIIRGTDIPNLQSGSCGATPTRWIESKKYKTRQLRDGDIVIEVSGGSPTQSTGRSMYITNGILQRLGGMVAPASFCRKFVPASSELGLLAGVVLTFLYKKGRMWEYQNQSTGISNFQTNTFLSNEFLVIPTADVLKIFYRKIRPLIDRTHSNENIQLSEIRDLLLPKLLSGQLRIPDAEAQFAEAGL